MLKKSYNLQNKTQLMEIVDIISNGSNRNSIGMVVTKLMIVASVYMLWQERNLRLIRSESTTEEILCKVISEQVRNKLMSLKPSEGSHKAFEALQWIVSCNLKFSWCDCTYLTPIASLIGLGRDLGAYVWCMMGDFGPPYTLSKEERLDLGKGECSLSSDALLFFPFVYPVRLQLLVIHEVNGLRNVAMMGIALYLG
ncbi:hypothetical protein Tco_0693233 [Tanacetum coccineum]